MRWFGGYLGRGHSQLLPAGGRLLCADPPVWVIGDWPARYVRVVTGQAGVAAVVGPCSATDAELADLLVGVPDSALTAWTGAHTLVRVFRRGQVLIMTDPAGACPVYTMRVRGGDLVWGSSSWALAALSGKRVDARWLAANLLTPAADVPGRSAWTDVTPLPPGHRVLLTPDRAPALTPVWAPVPRSEADAVAELRDTLAEAVRIRVNPAAVPAADLSGGLDSTTLAVLAAGEGPVSAVTIHPAGVTSGGDLDHARATAAVHPNLRHLLLPLHDRHLPYAELETAPGTLPATDEPAPSTLTWTMLSAQLRMLADTGVDCHLTGDGGDTLFSPPPVYLADLARRGRWLRLAGHAQGWARRKRTSPWPLLAQAVAVDVGGLAGTGGPPAWLTTRAVNIAADLAADASGASPGLGYADRAVLAETRFVARTAHADAQLADTFGIAMHNPYLDARVLDVVLGVPAWRRGSPYRYKPLLAQAAAGLLPETVRNRAAKGVFAADHHRGLRANLAHVTQLADGHLAGLGLVDPDRVRVELDRAAVGVDTDWGRLEPLLAAEVWLRTVDVAPPVLWTTCAKEASTT